MSGQTWMTVWMAIFVPDAVFNQERVNFERNR